MADAHLLQQLLVDIHNQKRADERAIKALSAERADADAALAALAAESTAADAKAASLRTLAAQLRQSVAAETVYVEDFWSAVVMPLRAALEVRTAAAFSVGTGGVPSSSALALLPTSEHLPLPPQLFSRHVLRQLLLGGSSLPCDISSGTQTVPAAFLAEHFGVSAEAIADALADDGVALEAPPKGILAAVEARVEALRALIELRRLQRFAKSNKRKAPPPLPQAPFPSSANTHHHHSLSLGHSPPHSASDGGLGSRHSGPPSAPSILNAGPSNPNPFALPPSDEAYDEPYFSATTTAANHFPTPPPAQQLSVAVAGGQYNGYGSAFARARNSNACTPIGASAPNPPPQVPSPFPPHADQRPSAHPPHSFSSDSQQQQEQQLQYQHPSRTVTAFNPYLGQKRPPAEEGADDGGSAVDGRIAGRGRGGRGRGGAARQIPRPHLSPYFVDDSASGGQQQQQQAHLQYPSSTAGLLAQNNEGRGSAFKARQGAAVCGGRDVFEEPMQVMATQRPSLPPALPATSTAGESAANAGGAAQRPQTLQQHSFASAASYFLGVPGGDNDDDPIATVTASQANFPPKRHPDAKPNQQQQQQQLHNPRPQQQQRSNEQSYGHSRPASTSAGGGGLPLQSAFARRGAVKKTTLTFGR